MSKTDTTHSDAEQHLQRLSDAVTEARTYIDECGHTRGFYPNDCAICDLKYELRRTQEVLDGGGK